MSSKAKKIEKSLSSLIFPKQMYETFAGSVIVCNYIFEGKTWEDGKLQEVRKLWSKVSAHPEKYFEENKDAYDMGKILKVFGLERTWEYPVVLVKSKLNALVMPYITDKDEEGNLKVYPLPLREDMFLPYTARHPESIQVINWSENEKEKDRGSGTC